MPVDPNPQTAAPRTPEAMRGAMAEYVHAIHQAYVDAAAPLAPADRARLPLLAAGEVTVLAVGTRNLHVLATTESLPRPEGPEVQIDDGIGPLTWHLRFFDPVIEPALGLIDEADAPAPERVREVLGVRTVVYHVTVPPGGGLSPHHAQHAGTGLAHSHAAAGRDYDSISALAARHSSLVAEMRTADVAGLRSALLLLAREIAPGSDALADLPLADVDPERVRRTLLAALREGSA